MSDADPGNSKENSKCMFHPVALPLWTDSLWPQARRLLNQTDGKAHTQPGAWRVGKTPLVGRAGWVRLDAAGLTGTAWAW